MKTAEQTQKNRTATTMFNLIILDESGSMSCVKESTIGGCNEVLNTISSAQKKSGDKVRHLVSIYAFQSDAEIPSRYLVKNQKPENVSHITKHDYKPWGATPLLDAVGSTLSELKTISETHEDATGVITIMTDGHENSSQLYSWQQVAELIRWFKEQGWTVNLIGANIDVNAMASHMNIDRTNTMAYTQSNDGSRKMWKKFREAQEVAMEEEMACSNIAAPERMKARQNRAKTFFKK